MGARPQTNNLRAEFNQAVIAVLGDMIEGNVDRHCGLRMIFCALQHEFYRRVDDERAQQAKKIVLRPSGGHGCFKKVMVDAISEVFNPIHDIGEIHVKAAVENVLDSTVPEFTIELAGTSLGFA